MKSRPSHSPSYLTGSSISTHTARIALLGLLGAGTAGLAAAGCREFADLDNITYVDFDCTATPQDDPNADFEGQSLEAVTYSCEDLRLKTENLCAKEVPGNEEEKCSSDILKSATFDCTATYDNGTATEQFDVNCTDYNGVAGKKVAAGATVNCSGSFYEPACETIATE